MNGYLMALIVGLPVALAPAAHGVERKYQKFLVGQVRKVWGREQEVSIFAAQIRQESAWDPTARSPYAAGLTQFTPQTAEWIATVYPELADGLMPGVDVRFDWKWSIRAMVRYDEFLYRRIARAASAPTRPDQRWVLTLRAYNGGLGWIYRELRHCDFLDRECCTSFRSPSACAENLDYPERIMNKWKPHYRHLDR